MYCGSIICNGACFCFSGNTFPEEADAKTGSDSEDEEEEEKKQETAVKKKCDSYSCEFPITLFCFQC